MPTLYFTEAAGGPIYKCDGTTLTSIDPLAHGLTYQAGTLVLGPDRILVAPEGSYADDTGQSGGFEVDLDLATVTTRSPLMWTGVELVRDGDVAIGAYDASEDVYWLHLYPASPNQAVITGVFAYWAKVDPAGTVLGVYANDWNGDYYADPRDPAEGQAVLMGAHLYWNADGQGLLFRLNRSTGVVEWLSMQDGASGVEGDPFWAAPIGATDDGRLVMWRRETIADGEERCYVGIYDVASDAGWVDHYSEGNGGPIPAPDVEWPMQVATGTPDVAPQIVNRPGLAAGPVAYSQGLVYYAAYEEDPGLPGEQHNSFWTLDLADGSFTQFFDLDSIDGAGFTGGTPSGLVVLNLRPSITGEPLDGRRRFAP